MLKALAEILKYHGKVLIFNPKYLISAVGFLIVALYSKKEYRIALEPSPLLLFLLSLILIMVTITVNVIKSGAIFMVHPMTFSTDILKIVATIISQMPFLVSLLLLIKIPVVALICIISLLVIEISSIAKIFLVLVGLAVVVTENSFGFLISYLTVLLIVFAGKFFYEKLVDVYFIARTYITTLGIVHRGIIILFAITLFLIVRYLNSVGCLVEHSPTSFVVQCSPRFYESGMYLRYSQLIGWAGTVGRIFASLVWMLFMVPDTYLDSHLRVLHSLNPERLVKRLFKDLIQYLLALITVVGFYVISGTLDLWNFAYLVVSLAFFKVLLSLLLPSIEGNLEFLWYFGSLYLLQMIPLDLNAFRNTRMAFVLLIASPFAYRLHIMVFRRCSRW
ncbi:hypothetical protein A3L04_00475 [Thermococcus chitonophagus]|uniref:Uncharacterized protein n=1 Tax=Thermococcus chitonophagus TaxID=54262 RepID=A0A160VPZ4_9EURY|nr:hypothetical protein [Thermococcus chitonophagus]ASJ15656.1 hypothetical protein A3L04_00475 [Thermococcus chitonophagus]CUX76865.1 hypothetical protein CHITON_0086 [Thermococcus chitonophagus]